MQTAEYKVLEWSVLGFCVEELLSLTERKVFPLQNNLEISEERFQEF